jgi:hypothetical protein
MPPTIISPVLSSRELLILTLGPLGVCFLVVAVVLIYVWWVRSLEGRRERIRNRHAESVSEGSDTLGYRESSVLNTFNEYHTTYPDLEHRAAPIPAPTFGHSAGFQDVDLGNSGHNEPSGPAKTDKDLQRSASDPVVLVRPFSKPKSYNPKARDRASPFDPTKSYAYNPSSHLSQPFEAEIQEARAF